MYFGNENVKVPLYQFQIRVATNNHVLRQQNCFMLSYIILTIPKFKKFAVFSPDDPKAFIIYGLYHFKFKNENLIRNNMITTE